jgi:hypothetical protein
MSLSPSKNRINTAIKALNGFRTRKQQDLNKELPTIDTKYLPSFANRKRKNSAVSSTISAASSSSSPATASSMDSLFQIILDSERLAGLQEIDQMRAIRLGRYPSLPPLPVECEEVGAILTCIIVCEKRKRERGKTSC